MCRIVSMSGYFEFYIGVQYIGSFDKTLDGIAEMIQLAHEFGLGSNSGWWV